MGAATFVLQHSASVLGGLRGRLQTTMLPPVLGARLVPSICEVQQWCGAGSPLRGAGGLGRLASAAGRLAWATALHPANSSLELGTVVHDTLVLEDVFAPSMFHKPDGEHDLNGLLLLMCGEGGWEGADPGSGGPHVCGPRGSLTHPPFRWIIEIFGKKLLFGARHRRPRHAGPRGCVRPVDVPQT